MKLGCGLPMGPLALLDLIGLDTAYEILDTMYKQGRDRLHAPQPIFKQMITAGLLGRKSGRGFYTYDTAGSPKVVADALTPAADATPAGAREVSQVGVVGSGTMATGIVEVFAKAGYDVVFVARSAGQVRGGASRPITRSLDKAVQRGKLTEARPRRGAGPDHRQSTKLDDLCRRAARRRGRRRGPARQAGAVRQPRRHLRAGHRARDHDVQPAGDRVRGGHLAARRRHRHALLQPGVDHAAGRGGHHRRRPRPTSRRRSSTSRSKIGKHAVRCGDRAGFIVNALLFPYLNDAVKMLEAHYASADDIDSAMKVGCGYPMGPFELLDVVGLDVSLAIERELYLEFREPGFAPAPLLEHLVTAGRLGRKTGKGFRDYA